MTDEHDRMGHMTSDKRKRHLEEHPIVDPSLFTRMTIGEQVFDGTVTEDHLRLAAAQVEIASLRDLVERWKGAALALGAHQGEDGRIWVITNESRTKRRWWWPW